MTDSAMILTVLGFIVTVTLGAATAGAGLLYCLCANKGMIQLFN